MKHILLLFFLFLIELIYLKVAQYYKIVDLPNERSSHSKVVIRGGGIIFLIAVWIFALLGSADYPLFILGISLISITAFIDDIRSLTPKTRFFVQFVCMVLLVWEADMFKTYIYWYIIPCILLGICIMNAYNFMDGINGITGAYSFSTLLIFWLLNRKMAYIDAELIEVLMIATLVFCFFNFRNQATCFAGDVGSIGMSYCVLFILLRLVIFTKDLTNLIFLVIYGIDVLMTIIHRLVLHENLLKPHRKHLFQLLANEGGLSHITVATSYVVLQILISLGYIYLPVNKWAYSIVIIITLVITYLIIEHKLYPKHLVYLEQLKQKKSIND